MTQTNVEQSLLIDPAAIQHLEMVWFESEVDRPLVSRGARLGGFDLEQSRISLPAVAAAPTGRRNEYLNRRAAAIRQHGGLSEVVFESIATMYGMCAPDLLCLSGWPDEQALDAFSAASDIAALRKELGVADVAVASGRLDRKFHSSDQPFTMRFNTGSIYELCALWDRENCTAEQRQAFFDSVVPSLTRHGAGPGMGIVPTRGDYLPSLLCLSEWPSLENFAAFIDDADHVEVSRKRLVAFSRMDATATRLYTGRAELPAEEPSRTMSAHGG